jgi:hypothetical protein
MNSFLNKIKGYMTLSSNINKLSIDDQELDDSSVGKYLPELELTDSDEDLIKLATDWEKEWKEYYEKELEPRMKDNESYWIGKNKMPLDGDSVDNIIFEAIETYIPIPTKTNPEPLVYTDNTEEGLKIADTIKDFLVDASESTTMKLKLKKMVRFWMIYLLGVVKVVWDAKRDDFSLIVLRPQNLILEKDSYTEEDGTYNGEYIGEYKSDTASNLIKRFPSKKEYITNRAKGKLGTKLNYSEWWTNEYVFWKMDKEILMKIKNPHWNYGEKKTTYDEYGNEQKFETAGKNHFPYPEMPYIFLSVFNLGIHPHDSTSQIEQSKYLQDLVIKRNRQLENNIDNINGGVVVSGKYFDTEQAKKVGNAFRKGETIRVPDMGNVNEAVVWMQGQPLPQNAYQQLIDSRSEIRNLFGVAGSSPQGIKSESTVRGKIIVKGQDFDRASLPVDYIERVADKIFNWFFQMMLVYYTEERSVSIVGQEKNVILQTFKNQDVNKKVKIAVKEGSLIPKDPLTKRNEAIDLWTAGALDPISLFTALDFPDPMKATERLITWQTNPTALIGQGMGMPMQPNGQPMPATPAGMPGVVPPMQGQVAQGQENAININQEVPIQ